MSLPIKVYRAWIRLALDARAMWAWHHRQMTSDGSYARVLIDGIVHALWQESIDRFLRVLARALVELVTVIDYRGSRPRWAM